MEPIFQGPKLKSIMTDKPLRTEHITSGDNASARVITTKSTTEINKFSKSDNVT